MKKLGFALLSNSIPGDVILGGAAQLHHAAAGGLSNSVRISLFFGFVTAGRGSS